MEETIIKSASVKVMLSHNHNHFEASMVLENDEGVSVKDMDNARKDCQRLCDKSIKQYEIAKKEASKRLNSDSLKERFIKEIEAIKQKPSGERTVNELAKLKVYEDNQWQSQFDRRYDYEDDWEDSYDEFDW